MKRFLLKYLLVSTLSIVVIGAILWVSMLIVMDNNYLLADIDKQELLENVPGHRIVIVGGSHAAYGLNSHMIHDSLPEYNLVNTSLHAGLGLKYMLEEIEDKVKPGDVAAIVIGMGEFCSVYHGESVLCELLLYEHQYTRLLSVKKFPVSLFTEKIRNVLYLLISKIKHSDADNLYRYERRLFDRATGDYLGQLDAPHDSSYRNTSPLMPKIKNMKDFKKQVSRLEKKGVKIVFLYAPIRKDGWEEYFSQYENANNLINNNGIKMQGHIEDYVLNDTLFVSATHLRRCGNTMYTKQIIRDLRNALSETNSSDRP